MDKQPDLPTEPALLTDAGDVYEIPVGGSLGLLALGYSGLMLWREKRAAFRKEQEKHNVKAQ